MAPANPSAGDAAVSRTSFVARCWQEPRRDVQPRYPDRQVLFRSPTQEFTVEKYEGVSTATFEGTVTIPSIDAVLHLVVPARVGRGFVTQIVEKARDKVMLPFPLFESDVLGACMPSPPATSAPS